MRIVIHVPELLADAAGEGCESIPRDGSSTSTANMENILHGVACSPGSSRANMTKNRLVEGC